MAEIGKFNTLRVVKEVAFGVYLDGGESGEILLPNRYVPKGTKIDDDIKVFVYHDNEQRLIATTDIPVGQVGEIAYMEAVSVAGQGAFMKWGIMKDVFVPISLMESRMVRGRSYFIYLFIDERTGRVTGSEKIDRVLSNASLTINEGDLVDLLLFQQTDLGFKTIINSKHLGLLYFNDLFGDFGIGDKMQGFVKAIRPDGKIDLMPGKKGYERVVGEEQKILDMLANNDGFLPYNDKSAPEAIYAHFGMSKKTFKMTIGGLYKKKAIEIGDDGIKLI